MTAADFAAAPIYRPAVKAERIYDAKLGRHILVFLPAPPERYLLAPAGRVRQADPTLDLFATLDQQGYRFPQQEGRV